MRGRLCPCRGLEVASAGDGYVSCPMIRSSSRTLYEERLWTRTYIASEFASLVTMALLFAIFPDVRIMVMVLTLVTLPMTVLSPYKIVVTSNSFEVRDFVNLFGWKTKLESISRITLIPARNSVEITYKRDGTDRVKHTKCTKPELLAKSIASAAPHIQIDTVKDS